MDRLLLLLSTARQHGWAPNPVTVSLVLSRLVKEGQIDAAQQLFEVCACLFLVAVADSPSHNAMPLADCSANGGQSACALL